MAMASGQGSFGRTALMSFIYGYVAIGGIYRRIFDDTTYSQDHIATYVIAPLGAFVGFVTAAVIHELGHYAAARILRCPTVGILIGSGRFLARFQLLGTTWEIHESLRSGAVLFFLDRLDHARLRLASIIAAGPLSSILLAVISLAAVAALQNQPLQPGNAFYYFIPALAGFTLSNLGLLISVLIPRRYVYAGRKMESDSLRLFTILRMSKESIDATIEAGRAARARKSLSTD
jgi:hypothetical protein